MLEISIDKLLEYADSQNGNISARIEELFKNNNSITIILEGKHRLRFLSAEMEVFNIWLMIVKNRI